MELWKEKVLCDKNCIQWDSEFVLSLFFLSFLSGKGIYCLSVLWRTLNILLCLSLFKISAVTIKWEKLTGSIPRSSAVYVFIWLLKNLYKINIFGFIVGIHYFFYFFLSRGKGIIPMHSWTQSVSQSRSRQSKSKHTNNSSLNRRV